MTNDDYADIIHLPHYEPKRHPRMSAAARAAQFAPFAALTGYDDAVRETARPTEDMAERGADRLIALDRKLEWLRQHMQEMPTLCVRYFVHDARKQGGEYHNYTGTLKKLDESAGQMLFCDGTVVSLQSVYDIACETLDEQDDY